MAKSPGQTNELYPAVEGIAERARRTPYKVTIALSTSNERSVWKAAVFHKEAVVSRGRDLTIGLTVVYLICRQCAMTASVSSRGGIPGFPNNLL